VKSIQKQTNWNTCKECNGTGKKKGRIRKKVRLQYQLELRKKEAKSIKPIPPKAPLYPCAICNQSGLISTPTPPVADHKNYPHIAIIGGGIGGMALAVACLHRGIPFTLYERDSSFNARAQGYGLTLQQASKALKELGISYLKEGITSTRHLMHNTEGEVIGEWGMRKWMHSNAKKAPKNTNIHIARQSLRWALLEQITEYGNIQWSHQLIGIKKKENKSLDFQVGSKIKSYHADIIVGADGIRSCVRKMILGEKNNPLQYLGCIVILGICALEKLKHIKSTLLDSATVFQTANGHERMYMMPYSSEAIMWQFSFPIPEKEAKKLSQKGSKTLKKEVCFRAQWHTPIPEILLATQEKDISGYPVYDRDLLSVELLQKEEKITLIGDAAHPMSPFKGQGANQALLDALSLAREIHKGCNPSSKWREAGIRNRVLNTFEAEMLNRTASKVKDSSKAAKLLHSKIILYKGNAPRGNYF